MISEFSLVNKKHQWLLSQVQVDYPTPGSLLGRELYVEREKNIQYGEIQRKDVEAVDNALLDDVYLVDFHRLTVIFGQLQSTFWRDEKSQKLVLEFFAQITLSDKHKLYIGFKNGTAIVCGLSSYAEDNLLISDLVSLNNDTAVRWLLIQYIIEQHDNHRCLLNKIMCSSV